VIPLLALLTIDQAVEAALRNNADLRAARSSRAVESARTAVDLALPPPELRINGYNMGFDGEGGLFRSAVGIRWSPPRPGELGWRRRAADAREKGVDASIRGSESRLAVEVRLAFRRCLLADARVALAERGLEVRRRIQDVVERQVAVGVKEAPEIDLAELAVSDAEAEVLRARSGAASERRELAARMGEAASGLEPDPSLLAAPRTEWSVEAVQSRALRQRPEIDQAAIACREADAGEGLSRNKRFPWVNSVQVSRRTGTSPDRGAWGFQLGLDLPWMNNAAREFKLAEAETGRCRERESALRARIRREVEDAVAALDAASVELAALDRQREVVGARAEQRARAALAEGRADRVDVLAAEARQVRLRDRWIEKRMEYVVLLAKLELAAGGTEFN
jgi:outer membrane protein TolC